MRSKRRCPRWPASFKPLPLSLPGKRAAGQQDVYLEKQLEWQLRTLKEVLSANGDPERAEILKQHADQEVCALVLGLLDQVAQLGPRFAPPRRS